MESNNLNGEQTMSHLTKCDGCGDVLMCDNVCGDMLCDRCQDFMNSNVPEVTEKDLEDQYERYLDSLDNTLGYDVPNDEDYVSPPESEFDDFDLGSCEDYYNDSMDGDHESAFGSIGWAENEYYDHGSFDDYDF